MGHFVLNCELLSMGEYQMSTYINTWIKMMIQNTKYDSIEEYSKIWIFK